MKQLFTFMLKEFRHVLRDRRTLLILFGLPVVQILIFGFALTNEVKNARVVVIDHSQTEHSHALIDKIDASKYFDVELASGGTGTIEQHIRRSGIAMVIVIPSSGEQVQTIVDASDPNTATTLTNYLNAIVSSQNTLHSSLSDERSMPYALRSTLSEGLSTRYLYNPQLTGAPNFVPGVMALVLMLVCVMMTSISIVREKEQGTMEVLLVSPFRPLLVIISKAVPYFLLSVVNVFTILLLSTTALGLPIKGSVVLLVGVSMVFIVTSLSLGLLISSIATTQQAAMLMSMMGMLLPTILFSGFMFPIENMPIPLQVISNIAPSKWYYSIVKNVMIKGLGFESIWRETLILLGMTIVLLTIALSRFKTRLS